jgi:hypothetical protein
MSRSDYKNIYEGYLDNTGYNNRRVAERYGGCGSEPMPYEMNEKQVMENYNSTLPDCGKLEGLKTAWTECKDAKLFSTNMIAKHQKAVYKFKLDNKFKYTGNPNNNLIDKKICKIPLPPDTSGYNIAGSFGEISAYDDNYGVNTPSDNVVVFDNLCGNNKVLRTPAPTTPAPTKPAPTWFVDDWRRTCLTKDVIRSNYWNCDNKNRERCCPGSKSWYTNNCDFHINPCNRKSIASDGFTNQTSAKQYAYIAQ